MTERILFNTADNKRPWPPSYESERKETIDEKIVGQYRRKESVAVVCMEALGFVLQKLDLPYEPENVYAYAEA